MKAVGYVRVSGKGQLTGSGPDRQREAIEAYAKREGLTLIEVYQEAHTGTEAERPIFRAMLRDLMFNGCHTIIVESLDRLAREIGVQVQLLAQLISRKLTLISANTGQDVTAANSSSPMLKAFVSVQGVFAELDKDMVVEKLRKARKAKREQTGHCEGRKPYGYYEGEAAILDRMKELNDGRSHYAIAKALNTAGLLSRSGKPWKAVSIKRILSRSQGK